MQERHRIALTYNAYLLFHHYDLCFINLPAPVINEAIKYIMHTSIGAKLFICKLGYCLKVDEKRDMCTYLLKFSVQSEASHKNIVKLDFLMLSPSNRASWHLQAGITFDYNCM